MVEVMLALVLHIFVSYLQYSYLLKNIKQGYIKLYFCCWIFKK